MNKNERKGYIYKITFLANHKVYVGSHRGESFDEKYFGSPMSLSEGSLRSIYQKLWPHDSQKGYLIPSMNEFEKYFKIEVLEWCSTIESLFEAERLWIEKLDTLKTGLNRGYGTGSGSDFGFSYSKYCETCDKVTKWKAAGCYNCLNAGVYYLSKCNVHDETLFIKDKCVKCNISKQVNIAYCKKCEKETKHRGNSCYNCRNQKAITIQKCLIHGTTKFMGNKCRKCISKELNVKNFCESCNKITAHQGTDCLNCRSKASHQVKYCEIHGDGLFKGDTCCTCTSRKSMSEEFCTKCNKNTIHRGPLCFTCAGKNQRKQVGK